MNEMSNSGGTSPAKPGGIVVGVDGSRTSIAALRWAAREARTRGCPLRVVTAYQWDAPPVPGVALAPDMRAVAIDVQHRAFEAAADDLAGVDLYPEVAFGPAAAALVRAAADADLLVVGTHGRGNVARLFVGSVSRVVILHAPCPVVAVPLAPRPVPPGPRPDPDAPGEPTGTDTVVAPLL